MIKSEKKIVIFIAAVLLMACSSQSLRINNYSYLYNKKEFLLHPDYRIYHKSFDTTVIYFKINTQNLLYTRFEKNSNFSARFRIDYRIYINLDDKIAIKTDSAEFIDNDNNQEAKDLIGKFEVSLPPGKDYHLAIKATDVNRNSEDFKMLKIYKKPGSIERQAFMTFKAADNVPEIPVFIDKSDDLYIRYRLRPLESLKVLYYQGDYPLARPPFDLNMQDRVTFTPASQYEVYDSSGFYPLEIKKENGFYMLLADTSSMQGLPVYKFHEGFPAISSGEQMVGPLRYITTQEEFDALQSAPNAKIAAENFWIQRCGSRERAKEVIREFYARVQDANLFFTSYKEGWKTDRGMIYIIFGAPDGLFMRDDRENWVYGQESNVMSLNFTFARWENPFTDNDYILERSPGYRSTWYNAIDAWRTGRLFSL